MWGGVLGLLPGEGESVCVGGRLAFCLVRVSVWGGRALGLLPGEGESVGGERALGLLPGEGEGVWGGEGAWPFPW